MKYSEQNRILRCLISSAGEADASTANVSHERAHTAQQVNSVSMVVSRALATTHVIIEARKKLLAQTTARYAFFVRPVNEMLRGSDASAGGVLE